MTNLSDFFKHISPYCMGVPKILVEREVLNAAIEFCEQSRVLRRRYETTLSSPTYEYDVSLPNTSTRLVNVEYVRHKNELLEPMTIRQIEDRLERWRNRVGTLVYYAVKLDEGKIILAPPPTEAAEANKLEVEISYKPALRTSDNTPQDVTTVDDLLFNQYLECIKNLTLSKLLRIPAKDWTDVNAANSHYMLYQKELNDAKIRGRNIPRGSAPTVRYGGY